VRRLFSPAGRVAIVVGLLACTSLSLRGLSRTEPHAMRQRFSAFPLHIGPWRMLQSQPLDSTILQILKVEDYVNRIYRTDDGSIVSVYVGFNSTQRQGETMHSPLVCLPGAGWEPVERRRVTIDLPVPEDPERQAVVNLIRIQKDSDQQLVLYWYQSRRRIIASEYWGKVYTVLDAIRYNRTDAALVRLIAPVPPGGPAGDVQRQITGFAKAVSPVLARFLPE